MVQIPMVPFALCVLSLAASATHAFVHPGLLHNTTNINMLKAKSTSATATWSAAYAKFSADSYSSASYVLQGPTVVANATVGEWSVHDWGFDGKAAYQNALMYHITGDKAHATKTMEVLDRWAATLKSVIGADAVLRAGIYGALFLEAAELIRYSNAGWPAASITAFKTFINGVVLPVASTNTYVHSYGFKRRRAGAQTVTNDECKGICCLGITNVVDVEHGQVAESGRDQGHTQLELSTLAEVCQIALSQGDSSCFETASNRLSKGFEFTAVALLSDGTGITWNKDAFSTCKDVWWSTSAISQDGLGDPTQYRPIWEQAYAYYHSIKHGNVGNIARMVQALRPEGQTAPPYDSTGFGTFLWALEASV